MRQIGFALATLLGLTMSVSIGCRKSPVLPETGSVTNPDVSRTESTARTHHCLGLYCLVVDTKTAGIEVIPLRSADWHFNMTGVLNATMGVSAKGVPSEHDPPNGLFVFDISLAHPFAAKPQFTGFDVKGILMTPGTLAVGPLLFADVGETRLENADGYTRWWNPTEFTAPGILGYTKGTFATATAAQLTATVNPYKLFADILGPDDSLSWVTGEPLDSDRGRAVFTAGSVNTRRYRIRFPMNPGPKVVFGYAVDAAWAAPYLNPPAEVPDDFSINANQPEAYRIAIVPTANSLYFDSESGEGGGVLKLQINVYDWQGEWTGDTEHQVNAVRVYSPGLMAGGIDAVFLDEDALKARYTADLTGLAVPTEAGKTQIICRVESWGGSSYKQAGAPAPDSPVSAFQVLTLDIPDPECSADTNNDFSEALDLDLESPTVDQLCAPADYRDFFRMEIPLAHQVTGNLTLYCDPMPTKLALYDESQALISELSVSGGSASLDLGALGVMPGTYYVRVLTQTSGQAFLYLIEPSLDVADVTPGNAVEVAPLAINLDPWKVIAYGNYAVAFSRIALYIYDYTNKMNPVLLSSVPLEIGAKPCLAYPYIYCPDCQGLSSITMVDISNPYSPVVHEDVLSPGAFVQAMLAEPGYLYVGLQFGDVLIYDISSDPAAPVQVGGFSHSAAPHDWVLVHDEGSSNYWLAMCQSTERLDFYNVTDKSAVTGPEYVEWGPGTILRSVAAVDNYCFAILWEGANYYVVSTHVDLGGPTYEGNEPIWYQALFLEVSGDYAYAVSELNMAVVDISDPDDPKDPAHYTFSEAQICDMDVDGQMMFHALQPAGLRCLTVNPGPATYGRVYGMSAPIDVAVQGQYMFATEVVSPYYAVKSVDIADPPNAFMADELVLDHGPLSIAISGGKMVVDTSDKYLVSIDCSDPTNLVELNAYPTASYMTGLGMTDTELYVGRGFSGSFDVWSLASWPTLTFVDDFSTPGIPQKFLFKDSFMYVLVDGKILAYSIVDPSSPTLQNTYTPLAAALDMDLRGDYLYIATAGSLEIADISVPQNPTFVAGEPDPNAPDGRFVTALDQFVILRTMTWAAPTVVRVWPPDDPTVIGPLYGSEYAYPVGGVLAGDGYYYERSSSPAIRIFDMY